MTQLMMAITVLSVCIYLIFSNNEKMEKERVEAVESKTIYNEGFVGRALVLRLDHNTTLTKYNNGLTCVSNRTNRSGGITCDWEGFREPKG